VTALTGVRAILAVLCLFVFTVDGVATANAQTTVPPPATAPADLAATAGNAKVILTWSPVAGATGYRIYRTSTGVFGAPVSSTTSTTHTSWSLINGTRYLFKVAAYNSGGTGPQSLEVAARPMAPPAGVTATSGDTVITLNWQHSAGALSYIVYRKTGAETVFSVIASGLTAATFLDTNLTNGQRYYYQLRAVADDAQSGLSSTVSARPLPPPPADAPVVAAAPGNARVTLTWNAVAGATSYKIYRSENGVFDGPAVGSTSGTTWKNYELTNGTTYYYQVAGANMGGIGPRSTPVSATPIAPPLAPADLAAVAGDRLVTLSWSPSAEAASYNVYRATSSNRQGSTPIAQGISGPPFVDSSVVNGPTYYYKVTALNAGGSSPRSNEASASPEAPQPPVDPAYLGAFRFLRQATWGPKPGDVEALMTGGVDAFLSQQFAAPASEYPNTLYSQPTEMTQEHFMHLALTGPDQLRQRVAWALHKIWVVSAVEVDRADAIVNYQRVLMNGAFGNYRDLMEAVTLNPAMGRYLNMLNNRSQAVTGVPPNENYARELMQLFTVGIPQLTPSGAIIRDEGGQELKVYTEEDVKELARIFTAWTFGDGNPGTVPTRLARENWRVPMEAVAAFHDTGEKRFLGQTFPAGQTAQQDLDQALDVLFNHPNVGPFIGRQLIQQLVTSNPSPAYVARVAGVFNDHLGVRGDLAAVVRAVLTDPEANLSNDFTGKLSEPVFFVVSQLRALNASVTDHPFMSDKAEAMGQKVFYPPSVFSYYSPGYRVRGAFGPTGAPMGGPEFQILTSVTALERANFAGSLLGGWFGADVTFDYAPFTSLAADPAALVDYCGRLLMGTRMSPEMRNEIVAAVRVSPATSTRERSRTAIYLTLVAAQSQVDW
jgi:uncharacterized protein (DUF1800 family)/fibronectin type 3 domain-containing protein